MTLLAIFNLRQKVYRCIYTHFDVSKIYKSLKSWSAISLNLNKKTKWVNGVMEQRVLPLLCFQYWSYDYVFTKNRYSWTSHANLAIWGWRSSKVSSRSVFVFTCHGTTWHKNKNKKNLLMIYSISVTFTWLYKTENIVM